MKKTIILAIIFALSLTTLVCGYTLNSDAEILDIEQIEKYGFSNETTQIIKNKILNGGSIYYGIGTTSPNYMNENIITRGIPTDIVNLPSGGAVTDYNMIYGNTYYSPYLFNATSSCTMCIQRTCTPNYNPCNINFKIVDKSTGNIVYNDNLDVKVMATTDYISLTQSHQYYFIITPLDPGSSFASLFVYAQ